MVLKQNAIQAGHAHINGTVVGREAVAANLTREHVAILRTLYDQRSIQYSIASSLADLHVQRFWNLVNNGYSKEISTFIQSVDYLVERGLVVNSNPNPQPYHTREYREVTFTEDGRLVLGAYYDLMQRSLVPALIEAHRSANE